MGDIEEIEYSLELPIGSKFYYWNRLHEVVESERKEFCCLECAFREEILNDPMCSVMNCGGHSYSKRLDGKRVIFKEVEETEEEKP